MDRRKIGIFDSGVGGLTVVKEVIKRLPDEEIIYFGDTARVPYGTKSRETVLKYSAQIMNFLVSQNVKAALIACGTISSNCLDDLKKMYDMPLVDVLTPAARVCAEETKTNSVGVIATERTIKSGAFERRLKRINSNISVYSKACPLFVPLAEDGWFDNEITRGVAEIYLRELTGKNIDRLLIGCTHYPLLENSIRAAIGDIKIINPAEAAADEMKKMLAVNDMLRPQDGEPRHIFYISDDTDRFDMISRLTLGREYAAVKVNIENY